MHYDMRTDINRTIMIHLFRFALFVSIVTVVYGGECCKSFVEVTTGDYYEEMWCTNYCCLERVHVFSLSTKRECCNDLTRRMEESKREDMCSLWWTQNAWAPALIAIGCLVVIIVVIVILYKCVYKKGDKVTPARTPPPNNQRVHRSPSTEFNVPSTYGRQHEPNPYNDPPNFVQQPQQQPQTQGGFAGNRNNLIPPITSSGNQAQGAAAGQIYSGPGMSQPAGPGMYQQPSGPGMYQQPYSSGMHQQPYGPGMYQQPSGPGIYQQPGGSGMYQQTGQRMGECPPSYEQSVAHWEGLPQKKW